MVNSQYYSVNAKLKAMSAGFLNETDYESLLSKNGVSGICEYLKNHTVYKNVLSNINEETIHRQELEMLLNKAYYDEYIRIFKFLGLYERKAFNYYIIKKEIEYIKAAVKRVFHTVGEGEQILPEPDDFFRLHTKIDLEAIVKAENFQEILNACRNTGYYSVLYREGIAGIKSEMVLMMLDRYYYKTLWKETFKFLDKSSELADMFGKKVDLLNILWVYRCKKYFNLSNEMVYTHIIPINYKMTKDNLSDIVSGDIEYLVSTVRKTRYRQLFDDVDNADKRIFVEENYKRIIHDIIFKKFQTAKEPVALAIAYFLLKDNEIQNIKTIIEGKRYSSDAGSIKELIVY